MIRNKKLTNRKNAKSAGQYSVKLEFYIFLFENVIDVRLGMGRYSQQETFTCNLV